MKRVNGFIRRENSVALSKSAFTTFSVQIFSTLKVSTHTLIYTAQRTCYISYCHCKIFIALGYSSISFLIASAIREWNALSNDAPILTSYEMFLTEANYF